MIINKVNKLFMRYNLIFILLCIISLTVHAQDGSIKGKVTALEDSETLIGANIIILNTELGVATDINGYYEIKNVPPGTYNIRASFLGYASVTLEDARVTNAGPLILDFELERDYNSPVFIIKEKPSPKMRRSCEPPWSVDIIPIKEFYHSNILDSIKLNPSKIQPFIINNKKNTINLP